MGARNGRCGVTGVAGEQWDKWGRLFETFVWREVIRAEIVERAAGGDELRVGSLACGSIGDWFRLALRRLPHAHVGDLVVVVEVLIVVEVERPRRKACAPGGGAGGDCGELEELGARVLLLERTGQPERCRGVVPTQEQGGGKELTHRQTSLARGIFRNYLKSGTLRVLTYRGSSPV